jgi:hypothetical protein
MTTRITVELPDDKARELEAAAARQGRRLDEVLSDAVEEWLRGQERRPDPEEVKRRRLAALDELERLAKPLPPGEPASEELLTTMRDGRADELARIREEPGEYGHRAGH